MAIIGLWSELISSVVVQVNFPAKEEWIRLISGDVSRLFDRLVRVVDPSLIAVIPVFAIHSSMVSPL